MINISKFEAKAMREMGLGRFVKKSASKHPKYYLVEDQKALNALEKYKKDRILYVKE